VPVHPRGSPRRALDDDGADRHADWLRMSAKAGEHQGSAFEFPEREPFSGESRGDACSDGDSCQEAMLFVYEWAAFLTSRNDGQRWRPIAYENPRLLG
jgi:hypothetical protein